jgi:ferredoxin-nitrite reductase
VPPEDAVEFCRAVAQTFKEVGDRNNRGVCRMRYLVQQMGAENFEQAIRDRSDVEFPTEGIDLTEGYAGDHVGVHDQKQDGLNYVGFNVIAGRMGGDEFKKAAQAARKYGTDDASVRLATDQNFIITHIPEENVGALLDEPFAKKYRPDPGPFSRGAVGCTGSEFCNYGIIETKNRVRRWAKALDKRIDTPEDLDVVRMHMSGCSASCAQPQIADIGFRGETVQIDDPEGTTNEEGDNIVEGMDFGLGGALGTDNEFLDWVEHAVPANAVIPAIEQLFEAYVDERHEGERFYAWCRRVDNDRLRSIMQNADANVSGGVAHGD